MNRRTDRRSGSGLVFLVVVLLIGGVVAAYLNLSPDGLLSGREPTAARSPAPGESDAAVPAHPAGSRRVVPPTPPQVEGPGGAARPAAGPSSPAGAPSARELKEQQDRYLEALLRDPLNASAQRGLIDVRKKIAGGDPALLRRQAAAYQQAIARGRETDEHYTATAMGLLVEANLLAAAELEQKEGLPQTALSATPAPTPIVLGDAAERQPGPQPTRRSVRVTPTPAVQATPAPSPLVVVPPPAGSPVPASPPSPPVQAPLDVNEPFVVIQIGPLFDAGRASEIAAELTLAGYAARVSRQGGTAFVISLGPYRKSVADEIVKGLKARFGSAAGVVTVPAP